MAQDGDRPADQGSVAGQVVAITGGAKGIGRFVAHTFARQGAAVVIADMDEARLPTTEAELRALGSDALAVRTDVRDEAAVAALMAQVVDRYGRLDVLVNNAAIVTHFNWGRPRWPPIRDMDKAFWDTVLDTNLGGTFLCTKHALRHMAAGARVLNGVTTVTGEPKNLGACVYATSKAGIRQFTAFVAEEERPRGIAVIGVAIDLPIATDEAPPEVQQRMPGPEVVGDRFVLAAHLGLEHSGQCFTLRDGRLVPQV